MVSGVNSVSSYSANVQNSNKKTNSTVKGAAIGGGAALTAGVIGAGVYHYNDSVTFAKDWLKELAQAPMHKKKATINVVSEEFAKNGVDMSKTTVSKQVMKDVLKPSAWLKTLKGFAVPLLAVAAIGAGIGAIIGHHSQKKAETSDISQMRLY